jgi:flagellar biosynthesis/type III secretory pathway chaperone
VSAAAVLRELAELLDREAEAIERRDAEELAVLGEQRDGLLGRLPAPAPGDAALLAEVERRRARNERAAEGALAELGALMARLRGGRRMLDGYRPGGARPTHHVDRGA